jgi:hypothetical protein
MRLTASEHLFSSPLSAQQLRGLQAIRRRMQERYSYAIILTSRQSNGNVTRYHL